LAPAATTKIQNPQSTFILSLSPAATSLHWRPDCRGVLRGGDVVDGAEAPSLAMADKMGSGGGIHHSRWRGTPGGGLPGHGSRDRQHAFGESKKSANRGLFGWILKGSNKDGIHERLGFFAFAMSTTVYTYSVGAEQKGYIVLYVKDVAKFVEFYANAFD
ncbi:hypothetical protein Taro_039548, partial [Colocasia esculenta]|nr:hypothetical protein [Colocasia esculenta]